MYSCDLTCIKIGDKITDTFQINQGVCHGCILSPVLFNIFLTELPSQLQKNNDLNPQTSEVEDVDCIIWADNFLLITKSQEGLNYTLSNLHQYTLENGIQLNLEKTKCMIFNTTGRLIRKIFNFGSEKIDTVRE